MGRGDKGEGYREGGREEGSMIIQPIKSKGGGRGGGVPVGTQRSQDLQRADTRDVNVSWGTK